MLPRGVDPHVHLDKAFTWDQHPNLAGTYAGALKANLQEHNTRTRDDVLERGHRALELACASGQRALRSHIDSLGPGAACSWEALVELREHWRDRLELQLVALVPIEHWGTTEGEVLAERVAAVGGLLGGCWCHHAQAPGCGDRESSASACPTSGLRVDLHIDESDQHPAQGMQQLLSVLEVERQSPRVTCSHASSLGLLSMRRLEAMAERMAAQHLTVVALPLTNGWLLGRQRDATPVLRPLAPIRQLQRAGVCVAIGGDNVADPWFPGGCFDPLALMAASLPLTQLAPWQRLGLAPFSTAAAALMQLDWDGVIAEGAPADLIVLDAAGWHEALMRPPQRRILIRGRWSLGSTR